MQRPKFDVHYFPFYISRWRDSESRIRLNLEERMLYWELLVYAYKAGSLPNDRKGLIAVAACTEVEFDRAWPSVQKLFRDDGQRLHHAVVDDILPDLESKHLKRSQAGRAGGNAKSSKVAMLQQKPSNATANAGSNALASEQNRTEQNRIERVVVVEVQSVGATPPPPDTISDDDPIFPGQNILPGSISKPYTDSGQPLDQLARDVVNRLMARHWTASNAPVAIGRMERILAEAVHPERTAAAIEANHASHAAWHAANRREKKKRLEWWLADGDYLHPVTGYSAAPAVPVIDEAPVVDEELSDDEIARLDRERVQGKLQEALRA